MRSGRVGAFLVLLLARVLVACGDDDARPGGGDATAGAAGDTAAGSAPGAGAAGAGGQTAFEAGAPSAGQGGPGGTAAGNDVGGEGGGSGSVPLCSEDAECDDGDACSDDACQAGTCISSNNTAPCDDRNECTRDDACAEGACVGVNHAQGCDDLSSCTSSDVCAAGACVGNKDALLCPSCAGSGNSIRNCDFADGSTHWLGSFDDSSGTQRVVNERLLVDLTTSGVEIEDAGPRQQGLTLKHGMRYALSVVAGASVERPVVIRLTQAEPPHTVYTSDADFTFQLEQQMQPFTSELMMTAPTDVDATLQLGLGGIVGVPFSAYFDDVRLTEVPCLTDQACDDGEACTADVCDLLAGTCSWSNTGAACAEDGNSCTDDVCLGGRCAHPARPDDSSCESDGVSCTDDVCVAGVCQHAFDTAACPCTLDPHCDDGNPCSDDTCNAGSCEYTDNAAACDDQNPCTTKDVCAAGLCVGTNNEALCDDGDLCTVEDTCGAGFCEAGQSVCVDCTAAANLLVNCNFAAGMAGWLRGFDGTATGSQVVENGRLVVRIDSGGPSSRHVRPRQQGLLLTQGQTYLVRLNALASAPRKMSVAVARQGGDQTTYAEHELELTTRMQLFTFELTVSDLPPAEPAQLELRLGGAPDNPGANTVTIDDVSIEPKP